MKTAEKLFGVSLAVISLTSLITAVTGLICFPLPVWAGRAVGIVNLISLPMLIFSTVKSLKEKAETVGKAAKRAEGKVNSAETVSPVKASDTAPKAPPKPQPQAYAAKRAAAGNKPKKNKKRKR